VHLTASLQGGAHAAQRIGVMAQVRTHGRSQGQVLGGGTGITGPGKSQTEPELGIIVARTGLDDQPEVSRCRRVLAGIELRSGQRLKDAPRAWLGRGGPLEQLGSGGRAAPAQQVEATLVQLMSVGAVRRHRIGSIM